jgi:hypothetical protein
MNPNRKAWNDQQQALQKSLARPDDQTIPLFLRHHAMVHAAEMSEAGLWSFADEVLQCLPDETIRCMVGEHSIAWMIWHIARCEDVTMNLLVAGGDQVLSDWSERLKTSVRETGNAMDSATIAEFSAQIDIAALFAYRMAVGQRTRAIVQSLPPADFKHKVDPVRLERVFSEGAIVEVSHGIAEYWGSRTFAGLLLMPATRHNFVHLNEALRARQKLGYK